MSQINDKQVKELIRELDYLMEEEHYQSVIDKIQPLPEDITDVNLCLLYTSEAETVVNES